MGSTPFDTAGADLAARRAALAQAIAEEKANGARVLATAATNAGTDRQAAIDAAASRAGNLGATGKITGLLTTQAAQPGDTRAADIAQAQKIQANDMASLGASNDNYMRQVAASVPIVQARTSSEIARIQAQNAESARNAEIQRQLNELQLEKAKGEGGGLKDILNQAGGLSGLTQLVESQLPQYRDLEKSDAYVYGRGANGPGSAPATDDELNHQGADIIGQALGLPAGYGSSLLTPPKPGKATSRDAKLGEQVGLSEGSVATVRHSKVYDTFAKQIQGALAGSVDQKTGTTVPPKKRNEILSIVRNSPAGRRYPKTLEVALADAFG